MTFIQRLREKLQEKTGYQIKTLSDCETVANDINENFHNVADATSSFTVSQHTIARIFGISEHIPGNIPGTMDIIARYLDFKNAEEMTNILGGEHEKPMFRSIDYLDTDYLSKGERIHIAYAPDRDLLLTYLGDKRFIVNESVNSKLHKGDEVFIGYMARGVEIFASKVIRDGSDLGAYRAAKYGGLTMLEIV